MNSCGNRAALVLGLLLGFGSVLVGLGRPTAGRAADVLVWGSPTVTSVFLSGIEIREPATLPVGVTRLEVLLRTEGSDRTEVTPIPVPTSSTGSTTLRYLVPTPSGALVPNTVVQLGFRVTLADGSTSEGPLGSVRYDDTRFAWKTVSGPLVRVHWVEGDQAFGRRALSIAEKAIADTSTLLGVTERDPIDFFIYADVAPFRDVLGPAARENVGGVAFAGIRTLIANIGSGSIDDPWVGIVIPHELTHLVFNTATGNPYHGPPHWLNEGLAVYLSAGYDSGARSSVEGAVDNGSLMPLTAIAGQFPTQGDRFGLAYDESVSAIDFLVRTYGRDALVKLVRSYAEGVTDDDAFKAGIGLDVAGFEAAWLADLRAPAPSPFGPQPAPTGPVPPGWEGAAPTPGDVATPAPSGSGTPAGASATAVAIVGVIALLAGIGGLAWFVLRSRRPRPPEPPAPAP